MSQHRVAVAVVSTAAVAVTAGVVALSVSADHERTRDSSAVAAMVRDEGGAAKVCAEWRAFAGATDSEAGARAALTLILTSYNPTAYSDDDLARYIDWMTEHCDGR